MPPSASAHHLTSAIRNARLHRPRVVRAAEGARAVVVADLQQARAAQVAGEVERAGAAALATRTDVAAEPEMRALVDQVLERFERIDLFCSNAGVAFGRSLDASADDWQLAWSVNVLAHVHAARAVLPAMLKRGQGYLLQTCSAAGLLTNPGDAPYTVSKHAAVGFAEWLSVTYGDRGVRVSALCPQGVRTNMLLGGLEAGNPAARAVAAAGELLEPEQVADAVVEGLAAGATAREAAGASTSGASESDGASTPGSSSTASR